MAEKRRQEDKLVELVRQDTTLEMDNRFEFITLAQTYVDDFKENLTKSSIELHDKYRELDAGIDTWQEFLAHPPVKKYINGFVNEMINSSARSSLAKGEGVRDAISVKKAMEGEGTQGKNENFIVFRLPDKENEYQLTGEIA